MYGGFVGVWPTSGSGKNGEWAVDDIRKCPGTKGRDPKQAGSPDLSNSLGFIADGKYPKRVPWKRTPISMSAGASHCCRSAVCICKHVSSNAQRCCQVRPVFPPNGSEGGGVMSS